MIIVNMPGGAVQEIEESALLWLRKAFDSEWEGATMLRLVGDRIYSIETVEALSGKFGLAKVRLAEFSAPDARVKLVVSAERVRQIVASDPNIYHEKAKSVLSFGGKMLLAVRESPDEAREKLKGAKAAVS